MKRLHPVTCLYITGAVVLLTLALPLGGQLLVLMALTTLAVLTPATRASLWKVSRYLGVAVLFIVLLNGLIFPEATEVFTIAGLPVKPAGLLFAAEISVRLCLLTLAQLLLFTGAPPHIVAAVMAERGLSPQLAYVFLFSITLFKLLPRRIHKILDAQVSRGLSIRGNLFQRARALLPLLLPLTLAYLSESAERSPVLELKGLGRQGPRTSLVALDLSRGERLAGQTILALAIVCLLLRIGQWVVKRL